MASEGTPGGLRWPLELEMLLEPMELCSGDANMFRDLSRLGMVCRNTLREGERKNPLSHRLLLLLLLLLLPAKAVSDTVWNSVLPL